MCLVLGSRFKRVVPEAQGRKVTTQNHMAVSTHREVLFVGVLMLRALYYLGSTLGPPDFWRLPFRRKGHRDMPGPEV